MYRYRECGLTDVILLNGYRLEQHPVYGELLTIDDVLGLHRAIGQALVHLDRTLNGAEFRFLRAELDLSQRALALALGTNEQSIAKWEKAKDKPVANRAAERMLRLYFLKMVDGDERLSALLGKLADLDRDGETRALQLRKSGADWQAARAA